MSKTLLERAKDAWMTAKQEEVALDGRISTLEMLISALESDGATEEAIVEVFSMLVTPPSEPEPATQARKVRVKQNEPGSKAWGEGMAAYNADNHVNPYPAGSVAAQGWDMGWASMSAQAVLATTDDAWLGSGNPEAKDEDYDEMVARALVPAKHEDAA